MKVINIPVVISAQGTVTKGLIQVLEDLKITGQVETIQTNALLRLARQNTKKTPGALRRLAVTQTPVKDHQLTLM